MSRLDYIIVILLQIFLPVFGYNLSPSPSLVFKQPNISEESSYFGYSVLLRENSLLVGAPRANVTEQSTVKSPGAVFDCTFKSDRCQHFPVDVKPNEIVARTKQKSIWWSISSTDNAYIQSTFKNNSYLGATIVGGSKKDDPLLICAPGFSTHKLDTILNLRCSLCDEIWGYQGVCHFKRKRDKNFNSLVMNEKKHQFGKNDMPNQVYAQMGFSADYIKDQLFVMGAPGLKGSLGGSIVLNKQLQLLNANNIWHYSYTGYATSTGNLKGRNFQETVIVETSPHGSSGHSFKRIGMATIKTLNGIHIHTVDSKQYGEFFGYSVLVEDVDNDKGGEILIGAPLHVNSTDCNNVNNDNDIKINCEDVGIVYVYKIDGNVNKQHKYNLQFERIIIRSPFGSKGRFGSSIAKLGDIDLDGYNDVAISAPHAFGTGAVAIYLGGKNGLSSQPSQILKPSAAYRNSMFGFAISKGVDTDDNGFNDLAIGAPLSDTVFYFRSYPIVEIIASIRSTQELIPLNATQIEIEVCYKFNTQPKKLKDVLINLNITLDSDLKRFSLNETSFKRKAEYKEECDKLNAIIKEQQNMQFLIAIPMLLNVNLVNDGTTSEEFCEDCAVLKPFEPIKNAAFYNHGCNDICQVDLSLEANVTRMITLDVDKTISVGYYVKNNGDRAFNAKLTINATSSHLNFKGSSSHHCKRTTDSEIECVLKTIDQNADQTIYVNVIYDYDAINFEDVNELTLTASVSSAGNEVNRDDNNVKSVIKLHRNSNLELVGNPLQNTIELNDTITVYDLEYSLRLTNSGPSRLKKADIIITMPYKIYDNIFIHNDTIINDDSNVFEPIEHGKEVLFESENITKAQLTSKYKSAKYQIVDCNASKNVKCMQTRYPMLPLSISETVTILIKYRFDASFMKKSKIEYWATMLNATIDVENINYNEVNTTVRLNPIEIRYIFNQPWPIWVWIVSIVISIFLLGMLTWFLAKRGFFKRQTKEQMEKRLLQKTEKDRMKEDMERSLRKSTIEEQYKSNEAIDQEI